jgi:RNA polymerase sigma-70 factor (ECF subfamily)
MADDDSFDEIMTRLRKGDQAAAAEVFHRFARRLVTLARSRLDERLQQKVDPEDVLQSVFRTFFRRNDEGEFTLDGWADVWSLLTVLTVRKCGRWRDRFNTNTRNIRSEVSVETLAGEYGLEPESLARDPSPVEALMLAELVEALLRGLSERDQSILLLRLQHYQPGEISEQLRVPVRTVHRVLERVKRRLKRTLDQDSGHRAT